MIKIEFLDQEVQDIIYRIAHKYENFNILDEDNLVNSFWNNIELKGSCEFGLEQAISDYLLQQNEFGIDGKYFYIIDHYQCENTIIKNIEISDNKIIDDDYIDELFDNKPKEQRMKDIMNADFWDN